MIWEGVVLVVGGWGVGRIDGSDSDVDSDMGVRMMVETVLFVCFVAWVLWWNMTLLLM